MSSATLTGVRHEIVYPDSDGHPMADNTKQFDTIVMIKGGLDGEFADDPNAFIAGDLLWYPEEGKPQISTAPDVLVAFGRPKGYRGSYKQWEEGGIAPQVVFEIWSPNNRPSELTRKLDFYDRYGVEEFYFYDPDTGDLSGWLRKDGKLRLIENMLGWVSPRLKIRFGLEAAELVIYGNDNRPFVGPAELRRQRDVAEREAENARRQLERETERAAAAEAREAKLQALLDELQKANGHS